VYTAAEMKQFPMVKDAGVIHFITGLTNPDTPNTIKNSRLHSLGKTLKKNEKVPVMFHAIATRPATRAMRKIDYDSAAYENWKKQHPNFRGFVIGEWDNHFIQCVVGGKIFKKLERLKASGKLQASAEVMSNVKKEFFRPKNKKEAIKLLAKCHEIIRKYYFNDTSKLNFLRAGWSFDHYALEWGADSVMLETTDTGRYRHQIGLFFARGASHQYNKSWSWFIALGNVGRDKNGKAQYCSPRYLKKTGRTVHPYWGISPSLIKRDMYLAYLGGASSVFHESWPGAHCKLENDNSKLWELSPFGKNMEEWYKFTQKNKERGISYVPVALLVPFNQGYPNWGGKPWTFFKYERPDSMIDAFMYSIVPYPAHSRKGIEGCLANSPYGDIFDVLMPDTPSGPVSGKILSNYKVAIMLGEYENNKALAQRLMSYVKSGGTLLLNIKQINKYFPGSFLGFTKTGKSSTVNNKIFSKIDGKSFFLKDAYEYEKIKLEKARPLLVDADKNVLICMNNYGKGNVIVTTVDYSLPKQQMNINQITEKALFKKLPFVSFLLDKITKEVIPFRVKGDIEYGINKLKDGWLLYLINNKGITKYPKTAQKTDESKTAKVKVLLKNIKTKKLTELRKNISIPYHANDNSFTVLVPPGDVSIIKISVNR
jgi:hypothetical protein